MKITSAAKARKITKSSCEVHKDMVETYIRDFEDKIQEATENGLFSCRLLRRTDAFYNEGAFNEMLYELIKAGYSIKEGEVFSNHREILVSWDV